MFTEDAEAMLSVLIVIVPAWGVEAQGEWNKGMSAADVAEQ